VGQDSIDAAVDIGHIHLRVADLDPSPRPRDLGQIDAGRVPTLATTRPSSGSIPLIPSLRSHRPAVARSAEHAA